MKENFVEITDEQAYAIENGEAIDGCISETTYEDQCMEYFFEELHRIGLLIDFIENDINRYEKTEESLRMEETQIIRLIGKKSFYDIIESIDLQKKCLRGEKAKSLESYHDLNQYINNTENSIKNKVK
jgi:hypothetical protein